MKEGRTDNTPQIPPKVDKDEEKPSFPVIRISNRSFYGFHNRMVKTVNYNVDPNRVKERNIFDTHCHLDRMFFPSRQRELSKITSMLNPDLRKAPPPLKILKTLYPDCFGDKFEGCVSVCCDPENWKFRERYEYLLQEKEVYLTFGCHPSKAHLFDDQAEGLLREYLDMEEVIAVGEIGLDETYYFRSEANAMRQIEVFKRQLEIAVEKKMPICIHLRGRVLNSAHQVMKEALGEHGKTIGIHLHCFNFESKWMDKFVEDFPGMKFGLVPHFFEYEVGKRIKMDKFLIETDSPYFIPKQLKEQRSPDATGRKYPLGLPGMVFHAAKQLAVVKGLDVDQVLKCARQNATEVYSLPMVSLPKNELREKFRSRDEQATSSPSKYRKLCVASCKAVVELTDENEEEMKGSSEPCKKPEWSILETKIETKAQILNQVQKMKATTT